MTPDLYRSSADRSVGSIVASLFSRKRFLRLEVAVRCGTSFLCCSPKVPVRRLRAAGRRLTSGYPHQSAPARGSLPESLAPATCPPAPPAEKWRGHPARNPGLYAPSDDASQGTCPIRNAATISAFPRGPTVVPGPNEH